jgi:hypothetical protein
MMVRSSLSLQKYCHSVRVVLGSFPTLRWGAKIWCWAPDRRIWLENAPNQFISWGCAYISTIFTIRLHCSSLSQNYNYFTFESIPVMRKVGAENKRASNAGTYVIAGPFTTTCVNNVLLSLSTWYKLQSSIVLANPLDPDRSTVVPSCAGLLLSRALASLPHGCAGRPACPASTL